MKDKPTAEETIVDIMKGMEGIGGLPSNKEYLSEFMFRLKQTQQYKDLHQEKEEKVIRNSIADMILQCQDRRITSPTAIARNVMEVFIAYRNSQKDESIKVSDEDIEVAANENSYRIHDPSMNGSEWYAMHHGFMDGVDWIRNKLPNPQTNEYGR